MSDDAQQTQNLKGQFLVASPWLGDPNFHGGIVYICDHDTDGTFGLLINQPLDVSLGEILEQLDMDGGHLEEPVFAGLIAGILDLVGGDGGQPQHLVGEGFALLGFGEGGGGDQDPTRGHGKLHVRRSAHSRGEHG